MQELGFWDYTCPRHGSMERFTQRDWDELLDDCATGGFNSLVLCPKWLTTGYRSRHPWLEQDPACTAISSDNALIHHGLRGARDRGLRRWLLVVGTAFHIPSMGYAPSQGGTTWGDIGMYDVDQPGVTERMLQVFDEIVELFGAAVDGLIVELEFCDTDTPHRIPMYEAWAKENGRPPYATIKNITLEPRSYPFVHWRDFTTDRRIAILRRIEAAARARGFRGRFSTITELDNQAMALAGNVNLARLRAALPEWLLVTYDSIYDRRVNRLATMDFCVEQPHALGFDVAYLTRGVMTFGANWSDIADNLEEQWRMSLDDAARHKPEILWFMGSDARLDGAVCSDIKLPRWGFPDGRTARKCLLELAAYRLLD